MKKVFLLLAVIAIPILLPAWGSDGHKMVATIAKQQLDSATRAKVQSYLGKMSFETAATWMDDVRDDPKYSYMKSWHFVNIDSGGTYKKASTGDACAILDSIIAELRNYKNLKNEVVERDLKILFHLCGDIAQPLHVGYKKDLGGNSIDLTYKFMRKYSLHKIWDSEIIGTSDINVTKCLSVSSKWSAAEKKNITMVSPQSWMYDSRKLLPAVYGYKGTKISQTYIDTNTLIIEQQIAKAGYRLAAVLSSVFGK